VSRQRQKKSGSKAKDRGRGSPRAVSASVHQALVNKLARTEQRLQIAHMLLGGAVNEAGGKGELEPLGGARPWELNQTRLDEGKIRLELTWLVT